MISDAFNLAGKVAMVTGVATGLGTSLAVGLAEAGADIVGVFHCSSPDAVRSQIESLGRRFTPIQSDLAKPENCAALSGQAGQVDILVNNAGVIRRADLPLFSEQDWDVVMNVNLKSLFFLSQAVSQQMISQRSGKIIHIASMLSFQGGIRVSSYTAAKHGVLGLTRSMANELAQHGINVNAIAPGYMATDNTKPLREDPSRSAEILGRIPVGRWGEPSDLQGAVVFLASQASSYVNGAVIPVDGGWLAR